MGLHRSREGAVVAGVCAGLAKWLGWTAMRVRVLYVLLSVLSAAFPGILVYVVLWIVLPKEPIRTVVEAPGGGGRPRARQPPGR